MINIKVKSYIEQQKEWPSSGRVILCQNTLTSIIVYQSYKPSIGYYAIKNQKFLGCEDFSIKRMSWIKTNFLWMMYRNGWATKQNQEIVLAIKIKKDAFEEILKNAVNSSYVSKLYKTKDEYEKDKKESNVRLQWHPDHDPFGNPINRRAIQIGIKGIFLEKFATGEIIESIENITDFVKEQREIINDGNLDKLIIPEENIYIIQDENISKKINIDHK
jgi:hypothetical protein